MNELVVIGEGEMEQTFVRDQLAAHLALHGVSVWAVLPGRTRSGGGVRVCVRQIHPSPRPPKATARGGMTSKVGDGGGRTSGPADCLLADCDAATV